MLTRSAISEEKTGEKFELAALIGNVLLSNWAVNGVSVTVLLMDK
jgi:hypothetical protein